MQVDKLPLKPGKLSVLLHAFKVTLFTTLKMMTLFVPFGQMPAENVTPLIPAIQSEPADEAVGKTPFLDSRKLLTFPKCHSLELSR